MSADLLAAVLDSLRDPVLVADPAHIICYMNRAAVAHYEEGSSLLGTSLLACHNARSQQMIHEIWEAMHHGLEERLITDNSQVRIFMRAVRGPEGELVGYYERYEPKAATVCRLRQGKVLSGHAVGSHRKNIVGRDS